MSGSINNSEPIIKTNHSLLERYIAITSVFSEYKLHSPSEIVLDVNEEEGTISYEFGMHQLQFADLTEDTFQMSLKESALCRVSEPSTTKIYIYRFEGRHRNYNNWKGKNFIAFDFEPYKINHPKIHINADKKTWGDHLSYPETTNLNLYKMSCPLAIRTFRMYACDVNRFPANKDDNAEYTELFREVDDYGNAAN